MRDNATSLVGEEGISPDHKGSRPTLLQFGEGSINPGFITCSHGEDLKPE